ncbi:hypothetical protein E8E14_002455 [Neopestalotiopsis sp. 37M]|nr:hypothetical protein E8E14_002455 [Neopestalotiopsis sp. 37M]
MSRDDVISLQEARSGTADLSSDNLEQAQLRHGESQWKRTSVLMGSALLQLPMWGFAMSYGVFQEFFFAEWTLKGSREVTGIIGTTLNGVTYLAMPLLFALFTRRWAHRRLSAALCGAALTASSFLLSSFSTDVWHLVATQGVLAALGTALMFSPTTLSLGEWYNDGHRALAYGVTLSCKNIVGSACPFLMRVLLDRYGFRTTLRIWAAVAAGTGVIAVLLIPTRPSVLQHSAGSESRGARRRIPWSFLRHRTFWVYSAATTLQSCGYGIPQTYLNTYAHEVALLSQTSATLLLTLFNVPGIASSSFFGYLSDNRRFPLSAAAVTAISGIMSGLAALLFWGLTSPGSMALLVLFSITFGFAAGGYSATWGGLLNEMASEAAQRNEAIDTGMVYGLLNGARGIGYVVGGVVGVPLLNAGSLHQLGSFGYGTSYGPIIIFTGLSSLLGGWGLLWKQKRLLCF